MKNLKQILYSNLPLKLLCFIGGYLLWSLIAQSQVITITRTVPVCTFNTKPDQHINAPNHLQVTLQGTRRQIYSLDPNELAVHINADNLRNGNNHLRVDRSSLFLPDDVKMVHYTPSNVVIRVD